MGQNPNGLVVMISRIRHDRVKPLLSRMTEGRVSHVVGQRKRLRKVLISPKRTRDGPRDLCHFQAVGQPSPVEIPFVKHEDLGFVLQPSERPRVNDPVPVTLVRRPLAAFRLRDPSTAK